MSHQEIPSILEDVSSMYRTNYMGFASFSMLVWDHVDTFTTEVEYIWKGKKGLLVYLFLINRYLTPLGFIVNLFAYLSPVWTPEKCNHFIRFEGSMTVIGISIVGIMMFLRIKALYAGNHAVCGLVFALLLLQICMNAFLLTRGEAVMHNPVAHITACTMIFDPEISVLASSSAWLPLLYDTVVVSLTLNRTWSSLKNTTSAYIMRRLMKDGLVYYTAIFAVNAVLTIMIIAAPPGLKNITAQLELLLTVAMMSRITLNLKKSAHKVCTLPNRVIMPSTFTQQSDLFITQDIRFAYPGMSVNGTDTTQTEMFVLAGRNRPPRLGRGAREALLEGPIGEVSDAGEQVQIVRFVDEVPLGRNVGGRSMSSFKSTGLPLPLAIDPMDIDEYRKGSSERL